MYVCVSINTSAKEPYISEKELYNSAKEPYIRDYCMRARASHIKHICRILNSADLLLDNGIRKEPYISVTKEPYISVTKEPYFSVTKEPCIWNFSVHSTHMCIEVVFFC